MSGWNQVAVSADGGQRTLEYAEPNSESSARFSYESRSSRGDQRRKHRSLHELSKQLEEGVVAQPWMLSELDYGAQGRLSYLDIKEIIERKLAKQKKGLLSQREIGEAVQEFRDARSELDLDAAVIEREIARMNASLLRCKNEPVGSMSVEKEKGRVRVLFAQLNNMSTKAVRDIKVKGLKYLEKTYDTDIHLYNEHGINCSNLSRGSNLDSWMGDRGKSRYIMSWNKHDTECCGVHQPGGTAVRVTGAMTQYVRKKDTDSRDLGRYCSITFWANPNKKCRLVSLYNVCKGKPKGLRTQYQQIMRYMQRKGVCGVYPRGLFYSDLLKQIKVWIGDGEELCVMGDINDDVVCSEFTKMLQQEGIEMVEFGQQFCGDQKVDSCSFGKGRITGGWRTGGLEITQLLMLPFIESVGDHRTWLVEFTTRSMLGTNLVKIQRAVARRLVSTNEKATNNYNSLVEKHFGEHKVIERLNMFIEKSDLCEYPPPEWLERKIKGLHVEMDELRMSASEKCRKY